MAAAMPAAAQAAAAENDGGAEIVEIVVPAPIPEESTEETKAAEAPGLAGVVEAATQKVAETEKDPLQSGGWPTPAESAMARKVELLDEVDELVKSGALKHAYSEMNPKDLVGTLPCTSRTPAARQLHPSRTPAAPQPHQLL
eukprot:scaffold1272_cov250-Pinguiococcus_pyrenoidosus.AAC.84